MTYCIYSDKLLLGYNFCCCIVLDIFDVCCLLTCEQPTWCVCNTDHMYQFHSFVEYMCFSNVPSNQCYIVYIIWYCAEIVIRHQGNIFFWRRNIDFIMISNIIQSYQDLSSFKLASEFDVNSLKWCYNWNKEWYKYQKL